MKKRDEATRDPLFLLQRSYMEVPQSSFDSRFYTANERFDGGGVFIAPENQQSEFDSEEAEETYWESLDAMSDDDLIDYELASRHWLTEGVYLTREEAEDEALARPHYYKEKNTGWRVYCVCANGELAAHLRKYDEAQRGE